MKRAVLVTAGTVVGVAAALNYVPRPIDADLAASGVEAPSTADAVSEPVADESAGTESVAQETAAPTVKKAKPRNPLKQHLNLFRQLVREVPSPGPRLLLDRRRSRPPLSPAETDGNEEACCNSHIIDSSAASGFEGVHGDGGRHSYGAVQVAITVKSGRIVEVAAVKYPNTDPKSKELAAKAIPVLKQETIAKQSASISNISGASFTCTGWKKSLQAALTQAGL